MILVILRNITAEPVIFFYFFAIYLLFSVFHPTVFDRYDLFVKIALLGIGWFQNTLKLRGYFSLLVSFSNCHIFVADYT